jgi:hypothetical protein
MMSAYENSGIGLQRPGWARPGRPRSLPDVRYCERKPSSEVSRLGRIRPFAGLPTNDRVGWEAVSLLPDASGTEADTDQPGAVGPTWRTIPRAFGRDDELKIAKSYIASQPCHASTDVSLSVQIHQ